MPKNLRDFRKDIFIFVHDLYKENIHSIVNRAPSRKLDIAIYSKVCKCSYASQPQANRMRLLISQIEILCEGISLDKVLQPHKTKQIYPEISVQTQIQDDVFYVLFISHALCWFDSDMMASTILNTDMYYISDVKHNTICLQI